jgi:hypothetical protein
MDGGRFAGTITHWDNADGVGHITPSLPHLGPLVVYRAELSQGGIKNPAVGMCVTYANGASGNGVSAAVAIERAPEVKR